MPLQSIKKGPPHAREPLHFSFAIDSAKDRREFCTRNISRQSHGRAITRAHDRVEHSLRQLAMG